MMQGWTMSRSRDLGPRQHDVFRGLLIRKMIRSALRVYLFILTFLHLRVFGEVEIDLQVEGQGLLRIPR